jgi:hypothetical protein
VAGDLNTSPTGAGNGFGVSSANYYDTGQFYAWDTAYSIYLSSSGPGTGAGAAEANFLSIAGAGSDVLKQLALQPTGGSFGDKLFVDTSITAVAASGGDIFTASKAGLNSLYLQRAASFYSSTFGFRCAYIGNI